MRVRADNGSKSPSPSTPMSECANRKANRFYSACNLRVPAIPFPRGIAVGLTQAAQDKDLCTYKMDVLHDLHSIELPLLCGVALFFDGYEHTQSVKEETHHPNARSCASSRESGAREHTRREEREKERYEACLLGGTRKPSKTMRNRASCRTIEKHAFMSNARAAEETENGAGNCESTKGRLKYMRPASARNERTIRKQREH